MSHDSYSDAAIRSILENVKSVAVVGASDNDVRPSYFVVRYLVDKGYNVFPVNPVAAGKTVFGRLVYKTLAGIPEPIDMVDVFRNAEAVPGVLAEVLALTRRPKVFWMQLGVRNDAAAAEAEAAGLTVVMNRCPKIEYGRLSGEIGWMGVNSRVLSSKKPIISRTAQGWGISAKAPGAAPVKFSIYALLALTTVIFTAAASTSRIYASDGRSFIVVIAMTLYLVGNLMMIPIMRAASLGVALSISTIAQLILANVAAYVIFHEKPAPLQVAGLLLGLVSMALIMLPSGQR